MRCGQNKTSWQITHKWPKTGALSLWSWLQLATCNRQNWQTGNLQPRAALRNGRKLFGWLANGWQTRATTTKFGAIKCCQMQNACMGLIIIHKQHFAMAEELFRLPLILFFFAPREFVCVARYIAQ